MDTEEKPVPFMLRRPGVSFPPPEYAQFRERPGLTRAELPTGDVVWLVTRHEDVRAVLTDPRISSNPAHEGFPAPGRTGGVPAATEIPGWFVSLDPPDHTKFRKQLLPEFTVRRIRALRPAIEAIVDESIDAMLSRGNSADLVEDFSLSVPSLVISALLGVPKVDRAFFEAKTKVLVTINSTDEQRDEASKQILRYLNRLIAIKRKRPGDDLLSKLGASDEMSVRELSGVAMLLLIAGHETTANNISLGVMTLLSHPEWVNDDRVVEELLRYYSVADMVALRVATDDVEIGGQLIKAGEGVVPLVAGANHDSTIFERPDEFDPTRSAQGHVAFGYGVHQCLGQNLVRLEMEVAYSKLFERIPTLEIAVPLSELPFKYDGILFGLHELPVRW
ncbi:cytochrome P450 [Saccharopolyspora dendranthemae]|uniref:Cytochrome P450 monooxygenase n=1 Tax=Saccharopolyspora dendranthemae TaxID=1181886 RepID=A0A561U3C8_9PSEU|nr:cytochrome P450 [Saccharopolyspora dendranthemae]TWF93868.1 cytochrome P450 monooxygenase [Saccharopolyspora dendranthemae]